MSLLRLQSKTVRGAHRPAGLVVVWLTQLYSAVQVEVVRLCREAKHVEAVVNGGTVSVAARASGAHVKEGNGSVVHAPG